MHFQDRDSNRSCRLCEHWAGDVENTVHAICMRGDELRLQTFGRTGCVFWVRAIGADDEDGVQQIHPTFCRSGKGNPVTQG
jgi:hypothetical protein